MKKLLYVLLILVLPGCRTSKNTVINTDLKEKQREETTDKTTVKTTVDENTNTLLLFESDVEIREFVYNHLLPIDTLTGKPPLMMEKVIRKAERKKENEQKTTKTATEIKNDQTLLREIETSLKSHLKEAVNRRTVWGIIKDNLAYLGGSLIIILIGWLFYKYIRRFI